MDWMERWVAANETAKLERGDNVTRGEVSQNGFAFCVQCTRVAIAG